VTSPLLANVGAQDALLDSQGTADRLQRLVPSARIRLLPDAGHVVRNQAVTIVDFLIRLAPRNSLNTRELQSNICLQPATADAMMNRRG
jgi:hypothetical protein